MLEPQDHIEHRFVETLLQCASESISNKAGVFLTFSASSAIKMAAQYCRIQRLRVLLIEPCFDNIYHLLSTEGVPVVAISERTLGDVRELRALLDSSTAVWIVQPNNPTGFCLESVEFAELAAAVHETNSTLIVDFCFRHYADSLQGWSQYELLEQSRARFIAFEDTGKTWAVSDTKVGVTVCSSECSRLLHRLHDQLLLNISPMQLLLLEAIIRDTIEVGLDKSIVDPIRDNREVVHHLVDSGLVGHGTPHCHNVPMELLVLPHGISCRGLWRDLREKGVDVLPAENYYWSRNHAGERLFRIPLSRPKGSLEEAVAIIGRTIESLASV